MLKFQSSLVLLLAFFLFGSTTQLSAQKEETLLGSNGLRFSGSWGGPEAQITRFGNSNSFVNGGVFGLEFGNALYLGFGHYSLTNDVKWDNTVIQDFQFRWSGPVIGYGINNLKRFHPNFQIQAGQGNVWFDQAKKDKIFVIQPSAGIELNILRWFHIGLDGGYRFTTNANVSGLTDRQLSGAFGQVSFKFGYSWTRLRNRFKEKKSNTSEKM